MPLIFKLYLLSLPFTSAFAITQRYTLPVVLGFASFLYDFILRKVRFDLHFEDNLAILLVVLVWVSALLNITNLPTEKVVTHSLGYSFSIAIYYIYVKQRLRIAIDRGLLNKVLKLVFLATLTMCSFVVFEFVSKNFMYTDIDWYIYRPAVKYLSPIGAAGFIRARGWIEEPGHCAMFLEICGPLVLFYVFNNFKRHLAFLFTLLLIISWLFTFSLGGAISVCISLVFSVSYYLISKNILTDIIRNKSVICGVLVIIITTIMMTTTLISRNFINETFEYWHKKLIYSSSKSDRLERAINAYRFILTKWKARQSMLGQGPGISAYLLGKSVVCLYLTIYFEIGLLGLLMFSTFIIKSLKNTLSIPGDIKYYILFSLISGYIHYLFISNYWYPWLWFVLALSFSLTEVENKERGKSKKYHMVHPIIVVS